MRLCVCVCVCVCVRDPAQGPGINPILCAGKRGAMQLLLMRIIPKHEYITGQSPIQARTRLEN